MSSQQIVRVTFSDGSHHEWPLPPGMTSDQAVEELRQVILAGQWFRVPDSGRVYSPYAIVAVDVLAQPAAHDDSVAHRAGQAIGEALTG
jgi:hypothetical protein